ncbi:hypothetical protein ACFYW1_19220, partial [Streptomyces sp. NPDC002669]
QKFDLRGIIQLIASLLGLTWDNIRARITRKGIPDQAMTAVESSVPVAKKLATEGPAGAVKEIEAEAGDLKATILEKLTSYLIPTVIIAGITWIVSLLNPASAFVRAVKGIIDIVTFIVNQGAQIIEFVNAVLDAVIAIANGGQAGVPKMVETALAASIPLLIGFLASLLGIGNLANKVKSVFHTVARPVNRAIDKIVNLITKKGKALWNKLKGKDKNKEKDHPTQADQDGNKKPTVKEVRKSFTIKGEPHTLFLKIVNKKPQIQMASLSREDLSKLISDATADAPEVIADNNERASVLGQLAALQAMLTEMESQGEWDPNISVAQRRHFDQELMFIAGALSDAGRKYGFPNLKFLVRPSAWLVGNVLRSEYQGDALRSKVYGGWTRASLNYLDSEHARLVSEKRSNPALWSSDPLYTKPKSYVCPGNGTNQRTPHLADRDDPKQRISLDHVNPMSGHWMTQGNKCQHWQRVQFYNDLNDLAPMCLSCNGKKGGPNISSYAVYSGFRDDKGFGL